MRLGELDSGRQPLSHAVRPIEIPALQVANRVVAMVDEDDVPFRAALMRSTAHSFLATIPAAVGRCESAR
jgi:hypothetical protein